LWIKAAVVYLVMGVGLGIYMGASGDHVMVPVHAHFNLLGWASLALVGLIYHQFPAAGSSRLATVQFWLHNVGLLAAMALLISALRGNTGLDTVSRPRFHGDWFCPARQHGAGSISGPRFRDHWFGHCLVRDQRVSESAIAVLLFSSC
jgi:hypothetical protein